LPGVPRNPDGSVNLKASAPKVGGKPDFSGIWRVIRPANIPEGTGYAGTLDYWMAQGEKIPQNAQAAAVFDQRMKGMGAGRPSELCLPHAVPDAMAFGPFKLVQTPTLIVLLHEEFTRFRQIHLDGRALPKVDNPSWFGFSVGHWEGKELVVESNGFNDRSWLDDGGHPHSESLRTIERIRRPDFGHLEVAITIEDAVNYTKPWSFVYRFNLEPDTELIEDVCENELDSRHISKK